MKHLIFILGCGGTLAHFNSAKIIASELLKKKGNKVTIVSDCDFSNLIDNLDFIKIPSQKKSGAINGSLRSQYSSYLIPIYEKIKPDRMIFESFFPDDFLKQAKIKESEKILIITGINKINRTYINKAQKHFDSIIISKEFNLKYRENNNQKKVSYINPLIREINKNALNRLKKQYGIKKDKLNILVSFGGGGYIEKGAYQTRKYSVFFTKLLKNLHKKDGNINSIIITGPFSKEKEFKKEGLILKKYEESFLELLKISDLLICQGGYATLNEALCVKTPIYIFPAPRKSDDQTARAKAMEKAGVAKVLRKLDEKEISEEIMEYGKNKKLFERMRKNIAKHKLNKGNKDVIRLIA